MDLGTDDYRQQIEILNQEFADLLPGRLDEIETLWSSLSEEGWDGEKLKAMIRTVHILSGSGKTFGYAALGRAAAFVEARLKDWNDRGELPAGRAREQVAARVAAMRKAAESRGESTRLKSLGRMVEEEEPGRLI